MPPNTQFSDCRPRMAGGTGESGRWPETEAPRAAEDSFRRRQVRRENGVPQSPGCARVVRQVQCSRSAAGPTPPPLLRPRAPTGSPIGTTARRGPCLTRTRRVGRAGWKNRAGRAHTSDAGHALRLAGGRDVPLVLPAPIMACIARPFSTGLRQARRGQARHGLTWMGDSDG